MSGIVIIGAGKTGRGFIGRLVHESGLGFTLIDKDKALIDRLNTSGEFKVGLFSGARETIKLNNFTAVHTDDAAACRAFEDCELVFVSVGGTNIADVGAYLASMVRHRKPDNPFNVILCENASKPAEKCRAAFEAALPGGYEADIAGISQATVFCTTIDDGESDILSENYPVLQVDRTLLRCELPAVRAVQLIDDFESLLDRKLYTYNSASAVIAYLGWWKGYLLYSDAANDPQIRAYLDKMYTEIENAICEEYGYTHEDQQQFAALSLKKFTDKGIVDDIARNAREPHRKLGPGERITGPAKLVHKHGGDVGIFALTAAAAMLYEDKPGSDWEAIKAAASPQQLIETYCSLEADSDIAGQILSAYDALKRSPKGILL